MSEASNAIALRLAGQDHALEPGRDYLLGSGVDCDLRLGASTAGQHARLRVSASAAEVEDLSAGVGTFRNGECVERAALAVGDVLRFGDEQAIVVKDSGEAVLVPIPALRAAAGARRLHEVRIAAAALRRDEAESFGELMAKELRRAPWLAYSLLLHLLLLVLLWLWLPQPKYGGDSRAVVGVELGREHTNAEAPPAPPAIVAEMPEAAFEVLPEIDVPEAAFETPPTEPNPAKRELPADNPRIMRPKAAGGEGSAGAGTGDVAGVGSGEFRLTVGELRKTGLEIVFVFDSTGSMTRTITDTKSTIVQMLTVLRTLVPDARVGLVTYRDRGGNEDYLVQQVPLDTDFWRASNFVQFVRAEGGGDRPEDVRAGLRAAFAQNWRANARRVVVLAGDAPPHDADWSKLLAEVRTFVANGRSFVHTLVTSPDLAGQDTQLRFNQIAKAGNGTCTDLPTHERVLQQVLSAAFGREYDQDLAAVARAVAASQTHIDTAALDLARRGGPDLERELRRDPVPLTLLNALERRPRRSIAIELIDQLGDPLTPAHSRQAIAAVLQRLLELPVPPIDPATAERPNVRELDGLRRRTAMLKD